MSEQLAETDPKAAETSDGLAVLEKQGSIAETFGIPLAVLA
ncbi:MAG: pyrroloquinoline quinone biosynthesis protein PqqE, partial [Bradyrhizobium sp.]